MLTICQRTICLNRLLYIKFMKFTINLQDSHFIFYQSLTINLIDFFNLIFARIQGIEPQSGGLEPPILPLNYIRIKIKLRICFKQIRRTQMIHLYTIHYISISPDRILLLLGFQKKPQHGTAKYIPNDEPFE